MSKELDALDFIQDEPRYSNDIEYRNAIDLIRSVLIEKENIDNTKPSKALEYLDHIRKDDFNMIITTYPPIPAYNGITKDDMFDTIKQALLKAQDREIRDQKIIEYIEFGWKKYKDEFNKDKSE